MVRYCGIHMPRSIFLVLEVGPRPGWKKLHKQEMIRVLSLKTGVKGWDFARSYEKLTDEDVKSESRVGDHA